jgi:hypothetical protein
MTYSTLLAVAGRLLRMVAPGVAGRQARAVLA